jgi:serine protease AprX
MKRSSTNSRWAAWVLVAFAALAVGAPASAQSPAHHNKLDEVVREAVRSGRSVRAIVRFRDEESRTRARDLITTRGGQVRRALNDVGAISVDIDAATTDQLALDSGTVTISVDAEVRSSGAPGSGRSSGATKAPERAKRNGSGVSIAIIDSGVQPHADLPRWRIRKFIDFVAGRTEPYDDFGHGTHVAGIAAGSGWASQHLPEAYVGAAPEAGIIALKVLDANGAGRTSDVIAALEWVAANHVAYNIRVVNMSLGHPVYEPAASDPLVQAAEALVRRGIVVVASAGNLGLDPRDGQPGSGGLTSPANGPSIIAVGAVDTKGTDVRSDDTVSDYSSRGPTRFDLIVKPDIVASGHRVVSLSAPGSYLFTNYPALHVSAADEAIARYMTLSGTSMAAPSVAGTAALMFDTNPRLSAGAIRAILEFTAQHLADTNLLTQGAGYLNAVGAVRLASLIKPSVDVGSVWLKQRDGLPTPYDTINGERITWARNVIWNDGVLLGDSAYVHLRAWDNSIVWGQECDPADPLCNIVWGQECNPAEPDCNIVWGQDCEPGDPLCNIVWGQDCDPADPLCNIVWGQVCDPTDPDCNIVWGQDVVRNIVWGQCDNAACGNIVWGQWCDPADPACNIVWGQNGSARAYWAQNTVWGFWSDTVNWTLVARSDDDKNIVWGQDYLNAFVLGQECDPADPLCNIVWGQECDPVDVNCNIVWGQTLAILTEGGR